MKKTIKILSISACLAAFCMMSLDSRAQGFEPRPGMTQVNFGIGTPTWGFPIYAGFDFGITDKITIGPRLTYRIYNHGYLGSSYNYGVFNAAFRADYHYSGLIRALPKELDLYGGASLGYSIWTRNRNDPNDYRSGVLFQVQGGGRWYFNRNWAANAELVVGTLGGRGRTISGVEVGLSYMF